MRMKQDLIHSIAWRDRGIRGEPALLELPRYACLVCGGLSRCLNARASSRTPWPGSSRLPGCTALLDLVGCKFLGTYAAVTVGIQVLEGRHVGEIPHLAAL